MSEKVLIFDTSPLISLVMNGLTHELKELKNIFNGKFIITKEVKQEMIDRPMKIKRFELEALKIQQLIDEGVLEFPESVGLNSEDITDKTLNLLQIANETFFNENKPIHLIDLGETSTLVVSKLLTEEKINNILVIDERTTRMLCEKPDNLKKLLQKKLHTRINIDNANLRNFLNFKIVRSAELIYIAYKKGLIKLKGKKVLEASLYALRYHGCSISEEEIEKIKKLN